MPGDQDIDFCSSFSQMIRKFGDTRRVVVNHQVVDVRPDAMIKCVKNSNGSSAVTLTHEESTFERNAYSCFMEPVGIGELRNERITQTITAPQATKIVPSSFWSERFGALLCKVPWSVRQKLPNHIQNQAIRGPRLDIIGPSIKHVETREIISSEIIITSKFSPR